MAENRENFIFISYSHKDSDFVIPVIGELKRCGFNVWYDNGIEAGSEWTEYIAEKIEESAVVLVMLSKSALESHNCRREINFAIEEKKEMLVSYIEDVELSPGMRMQLNVLQALHLSNFNGKEEFTDSLVNSKILAPCKVFEEKKEPPKAEPVHIENRNEQTVQEDSYDITCCDDLKTDIKHTEISQETSEEIKENTGNQAKIEASTQNNDSIKVASKPQTSIAEAAKISSVKRDDDSSAPVTASGKKKSETVKKFDVADVVNEYNTTVRKDIRLKKQLKDRQIKNALKHIPANDYETEGNFVALVDMTVLESGKEGFLFTKYTMYYRYGHRVCEVNYSEIRGVAFIDECTVFYLNNGKVLGIRKTEQFDACKFAQILLDHLGVKNAEFGSLERLGRKINRAIVHANKIKTGKYFQRNWIFHFYENISEKQINNAVKHITDDSILPRGIIALLDVTKKDTGEKGIVVTTYGMYDNLTDSCRYIGFDRMVKVEKDENSKKIKITFRDGKTVTSDYSPYPNTIYELLNFIAIANNAQ